MRIFLNTSLFKVTKGNSFKWLNELAGIFNKLMSFIFSVKYNNLRYFTDIITFIYYSLIITYNVYLKIIYYLTVLVITE